MEKKENEVMKTEKVEITPEQIIQGISDLISENNETTGGDVLKFIRKHKKMKLNELSQEVVIPMINLLNVMKQDNDENIAASFALGMYLNDEPFIPEYLGFEATVMTVDEFDIRTYRKDDMVVVRNHFQKTEAGKDKWIVTKNVGKENEISSVHTFDNMLEAVTTLKTLGSGVSVMDVVACKYVS